MQNNIVAGGSPTITAGGSTTISYNIQNQNNNAGDPQNSCNPADGSAATVSISAPAGVTATPSSLTFTGCSQILPVSFTSSTPGQYPITVSVKDSGVGTYSTIDAGFTLTVNAAPVTNTAPTVTVGGVTNGASYEFGNVPAALCNVVDKEDGTKSFAAGLTGLTGARAADGLGSQTASCSYTDAGGLSAAASATYSIVDTTKPLVTATAPASVEATSALTPVAFSASAYDAVDGSRPVTCKTAGGTTYASGDGFPVGTTTLTCSATDKAGNTGTSDLFAVVVTDTTGPVVTTPANIVVGNSSYTVTYPRATATDLVDGALTTSCSPASGSTFSLGTTTVTCSATDKAGNLGTKTFTVEVQDSTKPIVTVGADQTIEATGPDGATVTFDAATATDDVDGTLSTTCDKASGTVFPLGDTTVTCSAKDKAGNTGDNSFVISVVDTTGPQITVPDDFTKEATASTGAEASFTSSATDLVDGSVAITCDPSSGSTFALGTHTVTCTAADKTGNQSDASFTITVKDSTPPTVTVPDDVLVEATGPDGAKVAYDSVTASDIVDGTVPVTCSAAPESVFKLGTTTVNCSATDAAGNTGHASFTVKVEDTTDPVVTVPANVVVGNTSSTGASNVTYGAATAHDIVSGDLPVSCTPESGSTFNLGFTTVTCSATDAAGNMGTNSFTVEVQDQTKPVVTVPADITGIEATGPAGAAVTYVGVTALDDVDGLLAATCDRLSGSVFPLGTTTVTCSANDKAGNKADNTFTVTVQDTTAPAVSVSDNKAATATSATGAVVTFADPKAMDIVDGTVAASCDRASGSVFPLGSTTVTCSATDKAGNKGSKTFTVTVTAAWSNVLQPVNVDGSSVFKLGSTVPVKFQLTGASAGVKDLAARLYLQRLAAVGTSGSVLEAISTSNATTGNLFRYDATSGQYIFNLATKTLSAGTYQLKIDLGDGVPHTVNITLR
ncbi:HYR domain-containing protein [Terrabacter sp. C0L_2]|uniref:HYR domain-containing protein n=1 Tax=Terrabacter sp. C0L_2 TaxID=3108389 RepID=UPI002ED1C18E|nr:HYR domain-containing protein [Terrabacter sp. C0L_2]